MNIRKKADEAYQRISRAEQEVDLLRKELHAIQDDCPHALATGDWCEDCDKYLGQVRDARPFVGDLNCE